MGSEFRRPCPRTLDRPILVFGLEPEDLVIIGLVAGGLLMLADPLIAVGTGFGLWIALMRLKAGKPPGYLFTLAYRLGVLSVLPRSLRPLHLLPPLARGGPGHDPTFGIWSER